LALLWIYIIGVRVGGISVGVAAVSIYMKIAQFTEAIFLSGLFENVFTRVRTDYWTYKIFLEVEKKKYASM
jgi:hypothetical protein